MKMNKLALACGVALLGATAVAQAELSANIGVTSNYVWRGATQTDDGAAVQGGIDWAHDSGFYVGTWASNVEFPSEVEVVGVGADGLPGTADDTVETVSSGGSEVEWDLYAGYAGEVGDFGYDIGVFHYMYPDSDDADFTELGVSGSFKWLTVGLNYTFNSSVDDTDADAEAFIEGDLYYYAGLSFDLQDGWSIGGTIGHYAFEDDGVADASLDYTHYQLDIGKSAGDFGDFTLSLSKADEEANGGDDDMKVFVSWGKSF